MSDIKKPTILLSNDDGIHAKGINSIIPLLREYGNLVVVAPEQGQSAQSHAITIKEPLFLKKIHEEEGLTKYVCSGTSVDCVKMALNNILSEKPDYVVSGINHGTNAAISVIYSGTMAAALEAHIHGIPSIGFSVVDYSEDADFTASVHFARIILDQLFPSRESGFCFNVNVPKGPIDSIHGIKVGRQARSSWVESFEKRTNPAKKDYYWLTGHFINFEPDAVDTDDWALRNGYVSIVPVQADFTAHHQVSEYKHLETKVLNHSSK